MKIDSVHAEFLSGNAVSTTVSTHSIVSRDGNGGVWATKLNSTNLALSHNATARTSDTIFYSSDDDIVRKNTAAGMRASLSLENSAMIPASSTNLASNIVVRDASGNFSAGVIEADGSKISSLNASNLATGTVHSDRLSLSASDIPTLNQDTTGNAATASSCSGNSATATNADKLDGVHLDDIFNNMGGAHSNRSDFDSVPDAGCYYITGNTNGPGVNSATQYYGFTLGLGGHDPVAEGTSNGKYGCQLYWGRNVSNPYINVRYLENGTWGSWNKASAGYADSAGYATSAGTAAACSGNAATATTADACSGNAATATTAAACSGNAATATTAAACSGNALTVTRKENYVHTYITSATFSSSGISQSSSGYIPSSAYSFWNGYNNLSIPDAVDYNDGRSLIVSLDLSFFGEVVCNNNENVMFSIDMAITNSGNYWITTLSSSAPNPGNRTKGITTHNINFWRDHYSTGETINITTRFVIPNSYLGYNYKIFPLLVAWTGNISDSSGLRIYTNRTRSDSNDWTYERGLTVGRVIFQKE